MISQKQKPKTSESIGIAGIGYVGGAVKNWFQKQRYPLFLYDKYKKIGSIEEVNQADIIFVCVPTPYHKRGGYDDSAVLESLKNISGSKIVVIKSTVLPRTTEKFQKKFPQHKILFNPEFLVAKTAKRDFLKPKRQVVGFTRKSKGVAKKVMAILPKASYQRIIPATEAEMVKYFGNSFLASKVVFANQIYDLCRKLKINYEVVKEVVSHDPRIGLSHLEIFHDGYRGYSGGCFLKDVKSLLQLTKKKKVDLKLLETVDKINEKLINNSFKKNGKQK